MSKEKKYPEEWIEALIYRAALEYDEKEEKLVQEAVGLREQKE